jgi:hypothetical protein
LQTPDFLLSTEGRLSVYYAPFDAVNVSAKVAIIGITPGWQQMEVAFRVSRRELLKGATPEQASWCAKMEASFAGAMRRNLVAMLDQLGLARRLNIHATADLFGTAHGLTT